MTQFFHGLRSADALNFSFLFFLIAISILFRTVIDRFHLLIAEYSVLIIIQALLVHFRNRNGFLRWTHDLIFPILCILAVFDSLGGIVHSINPRDSDPILIKLDYLLFNGHPTVLIEQFVSPLLTDIMYAAYISYYFLPVILAVVLKTKHDDTVFDHALFLIMLCFYLSYIGYMIMPAIGPRYTMNHLQNIDLNGLYIAQPIQDGLNRLEGIKRDAFPSGHVAVALTVLYIAFRAEKRLFGVFFPIVIVMTFSTVYCRYHYVVDILSGALLSFITILLGELYHGCRSKRINTHH